MNKHFNKFYENEQLGYYDHLFHDTSFLLITFMLP